MNPTPVKIVVVYQSLLGIYGDQGNSRVLQQRARWRGIDAEVVFAEPGTPLPEDGAIYLLGGGEDAAQTTAVRELRADGGLFRALDAGAVLFAVCRGKVWFCWRAGVVLAGFVASCIACKGRGCVKIAHSPGCA